MLHYLPIATVIACNRQLFARPIDGRLEPVAQAIAHRLDHSVVLRALERKFWRAVLESSSGEPF